jgi:hypothetical protein
MKSYLHYLRRSVLSSLVLVLLIASIAPTEATAFVWPPAPGAQGAEKAILNRHHPLVQEAIGVQDRHTPGLWSIPDVMGTGVGVGPDGLPVIKVFTRRAGVQGIPQWLEAIPVDVEVIGEVFALQSTGDCPQGLCPRPSPIGVSTGHPDITAGTISARVKDAGGNVYALSNNHVYANMNNAHKGDNVLQPGKYDGGDPNNPAHVIGTLYDFEPIKFSLGVNYIDAAIAKSSKEFLGQSTLTPAGYGIPNSSVVEPSVNMHVQKYGRTTYLTHGTVSAINVTVRVSYGTGKSANFYDQIQISPGGFSAGGDSGSLIVTDDANKNPVGLLFAGSSTTTIANRIQRVLDRFNVTIDGAAATPPAAPTNLTASAVSSSQINLNWIDNANNEDGFKVERCQASDCTNFTQIATVGPNVTTFANTGLEANTTYFYRVRAYNSVDDSSYSNTANDTTQALPALPNAPSNLTATAVSSSQINLTWADNSNNETGFKIERCKGSSCANFAQIATVGANVTSYSNTHLSRNSTYKYRVRAYNTAGNSGYSNIATATTPRR